MKALSIMQPWATLVATGAKRIETRSWPTAYRGPIAIHASRGFPRWAREFAETEVALGRLSPRLPFGAVIAVAKLVEVQPTQEIVQSISALERLYGDYAWGRYGWILDDIEPFDTPISAKGAQGLWEWRQE